MGTTGSVAYLFERTGIIIFPPGSDEESILEQALDAGAHDMLVKDDGIEVITTLEAFGKVQDALEKVGLNYESAEMTMLASTEVELLVDNAEKLLKLVEYLEDLDDVQNVYSNASISEEVASHL